MLYELIKHPAVEACVKKALRLRRFDLTSIWLFDGYGRIEGRGRRREDEFVLVMVDFSKGPQHPDRDEWSAGLEAFVLARTGEQVAVVWRGETV